MIEVEMELVKYRDAGMPTYTYFWTVKGRMIGPFFDSEKDAYKWRDDATQRLDTNSTGSV